MCLLRLLLFCSACAVASLHCFVPLSRSLPVCVFLPVSPSHAASLPSAGCADQSVSQSTVCLPVYSTLRLLLSASHTRALTGLCVLCREWRRSAASSGASVSLDAKRSHTRGCHAQLRMRLHLLRSPCALCCVLRRRRCVRISFSQKRQGDVRDNGKERGGCAEKELCAVLSPSLLHSARVLPLALIILCFIPVLIKLFNYYNHIHLCIRVRIFLFLLVLTCCFCFFFIVIFIFISLFLC